MNDPRMRFVTVIRTELSPDLKEAKVFVSGFGEKLNNKLALAAVKHSSGFIQRELSKKIRIRFMPKMYFTVEEESEQNPEEKLPLVEIPPEPLKNIKVPSKRIASNHR